MTDAERSIDRAGEVDAGRGRWLLGLLAVGALYAVGLGTVGVQDAVEALRAGAWPLLAVALVLEGVTVASLAMVHHASARSVGTRLGYLEALNVSMSAFSVSQTMPGGGAVAGALAVRRLTRFGLDGPSAAASVALTATLAMATITAIAASGTAVAVVEATLPGRALVLVLAVLVALLGAAGGVVAVLRSTSLQQRLLDLLGRLHRRLRQKVDGWATSLDAVREDPPSWPGIARIVGWSAVNWSFDVLALWFVFQAFGRSVTVPVLLIGFAVSQVGAAVPLTPGGVGFVESGMVGAFVVLGTPASAATTIVLAYRILATWLPALAGVPALLRPPPPRATAASSGAAPER